MLISIPSPWPRTSLRAPVAAAISLVLLSLFLCSTANAYLYDTFGSPAGFPNRVDDHIDSLYVSDPTALVDITVDFCTTPTSADSAYLAGFGTIYDVFRFIDAISVENVTVSDCYTIVGYPRVKLIEWERPLTPNLDVSCCAIKARSSGVYPYPGQAVWDLNPTVGYTGNGVNVAIIDSGVDDGHPALAGKFVAGYDVFTGLGGPGVNPDDDMAGWFHGTFVAGIVMGNDPAQLYMGVAPNAGLVDVKIFNAAGSSPPRQTARAIRWVIQNAAQYNIQVANLSIGGFPQDGTDVASRAADALVAAGVVVVASAGNYPPSQLGIAAPGAGNNVIAVGGVDDNATIARGDDLYDSVCRVGPRSPQPPSMVLGFNDLKPEVVAYMRDITSCLGVHPGQTGAGFWQHIGNGTSWATAHVSGVVALLLEKHPGLPPAQVDIMLRTNAEPRGGATYPSIDPTWNYQYGWGIVQAADAVNAVLLADVSVKPWPQGSWNSKAIWAGHYPVKVNDPNTLNARISASGNYAPGVLVTFETMNTGWGSPWSPVGSTTVNVPSGGSTVATIPYMPLPGMEGHKCYRVTATYAADPNLANNQAQENIDVQAAQKRSLAGRADQRYTFPVTMCVEPTVPLPFRTADACICMKDMPPEADAWLEPPPPFDLMPGECQPCSLIVWAPEGVPLHAGHAVHVNGWFWGNGVAEGGVSVYFESAPPLEVTVSEVQYTEDLAAGASPLEGQVVEVSGTATTDNGGYAGRFPMQDGEGPWNGIWVTDAGFPVSSGDSLTVIGTVVENGGLTEIDLIEDLTVHSAGNPIFEPALLTPGEVDSSESYEGVLVRVEDVAVADDTYDDWMVESDGECRVGRWSGYSYAPSIGDELHVTGVVGSLLDALKLQPRDDLDIEPATGVPDKLPSVVSLSQNLPNPFAAKTGIVYALPAGGHVLLEVYNVAGKVVRTLVDEERPAGTWTAVWDGCDEWEHRVSNGVYFYRLKTGGKTIEKRMVLVR